MAVNRNCHAHCSPGERLASRTFVGDKSQTSVVKNSELLLGAILCGLCLATGNAHGEDWPTASFNAQRNAFSPEQLDATLLEEAWVSRSSHPPKPAWHGPAKWDAYADVRMHSMRNYDEVFQPISVGNDVYYGSSADDSVTCLDAATGQERWSFCTEGPVRIAPTFSNGKLYFGSDDGYAYCIRADDGTLVWKYHPKKSERLILNNGRFIPLLPIRSGVIVDGGIAYFAASLLPWEPSYLCAVDAETGSAEGQNLYVRELQNRTFEGPLAISPRLVIAPQGRVPPMLFSRRTGKPLGELKGGGGSFVVVLPNQEVVHGPGNKAGWVSLSSTESREQLATHNNARALVRDAGHTYLLTKTSLGAIDNATKKEAWRKACEAGLALIGAGNTLYVGKPNRVEAYDIQDGRLLWAARVEGRAYGLCLAQNRLLVSTDLGVLHAFTPTATTKYVTLHSDSVADSADQSNLPPVAAIEQSREKDLLGRWEIHPETIQGFSLENLAGGMTATINGVLKPKRAGDFLALALPGSDTSITVSENLNEAKLPTTNMTAEAWVRIDKPQPWGGIVGAIQDNGEEEWGWVLGYRDSHFCFGLAAEGGNGRITYLTAKDSFTLRDWRHVAGTYDGKTLRLLIDGKLAATSTEQSGPIRYASEGPYVIGAYRDKDENFPLTGMVHEVRVYQRALQPGELHQQYRKKAERFPPPVPLAEKPKTHEVAVGPWLQFTKPGEAVVRWKTELPSPTVLTYRQGKEIRRIEKATSETDHEVRLPSLTRNRLYHYTIESAVDGQMVKTPEYECDTFFNYTLPKVSATPVQFGAKEIEKSPYRAAAATILQKSGIHQGMCLDLGTRSGNLAEELVRQSQLQVLCVSSDRKSVAALRKQFRALGLYGTRVFVRHVDSLNELGLTSHWANLVVSESTLIGGRPHATAAQLRRILAPNGFAILGAAASLSESPAEESAFCDWLAKEKLSNEVLEDSTGRWLTIDGTPFEGAGEWSYIYGRANNSAFGGETLSGARNSQDLKIQWLGRPGPRYQADRSGRKTPPLAFDGRLFLEGLHRIVTLDIYNGSVLWSLEIPHFERFNIPRDTANWCGEGNSLFAAVRDRCWQIDAANGQVTRTFAVPQSPAGRGEFDWGYIASVGDTLIGSAVRRGTFYTDFWGEFGWYDAPQGPATFKVCSDAIFAYDKRSGKQRWSRAEGLIINSTITMSAGRLFFVEGRDQQLRTEETRRLNSPALWKDQYLVALDATTGEKDWEIPLDTVDGTVVFYMAHSDGKLVIVSSTAGKYYVYAWEDNSGAPLWDVTFPWGKGGKADHGSHMSRPAIVGDRLYVSPMVLDLATGEIQDERVPEGKCGTYSCTKFAMFFRGNPGARFAMWSTSDNQYSLWDRLRTDCWLSSIPAGGMLLSPEGGGGCSCGSWMETSIGFIPADRLKQ